MRPAGNHTGMAGSIVPSKVKMRNETMKLSVIQDEAAVELKNGPSNALLPEPLIVLKFGSSVLQTIADLPAVAGEIYRQRCEHIFARIYRFLEQSRSGHPPCPFPPTLPAKGEAR